MHNIRLTKCVIMGFNRCITSDVVVVDRVSIGVENCFY